jgi:hypothetical protein
MSDSGTPQKPAMEQFFSHLIGSGEHLLGGLAHVSNTAVGGMALAPVVTAARVRLDAAKKAFADATKAIEDTETGDFTAAAVDAQSAGHDAESVVTGGSGAVVSGGAVQ